MNKSLCETCKFMKLQTTNYCVPTEIDCLGNVIRCEAYKKENIIRCFINFIKKENV